MREVFACEDGHARERSMLGRVLETAAPRDLWIADRTIAIGSDDDIILRCNGKKVYEYQEPRSLKRRDAYITVPFRKGDNLIYAQVGNRDKQWGMMPEIGVPISAVHTPSRGDLTILGNTFIGLSKGIVLQAAPTSSSRLPIVDNLFLQVKSDPILVDARLLGGLTELSTVAMDGNWDAPAADRVRDATFGVVPLGGKSGPVEVISWDQNHGDFARPKPGSALARVGRTRDHAGAVAP